MMNQDLERMLNQVTPPALPPELRERVLAAVDRELVATASPGSGVSRARVGWRFRPGLAAAALLLASLVLNQLVSTAVDRRLAAVLGPRPVPRQAALLAAEIADLTDPQTGAWALERLATSQRAEGNPQLYPLRLLRMINQIAAENQEPSHGTRQKNMQMDHDRRGDRDRRPPGAQRILRLEHGNTA
jgi:hypothetical protein